MLWCGKSGLWITFKIVDKSGLWISLWITLWITPKCILCKIHVYLYSPFFGAVKEKYLTGQFEKITVFQSRVTLWILVCIFLPYTAGVLFPFTPEK